MSRTSKRTANKELRGTFVYGACPHCGDLVEIAGEDLACREFVHAWTIDGTNINAHTPEAEIEKMRRQGKILAGCGKKFEYADGMMKAVYEASSSAAAAVEETKAVEFKPPQSPPKRRRDNDDDSSNGGIARVARKGGRRK